MMNQASVLIVGAGAVGLVTGYHLSLGGTAVTFFVRPQRRESVLPPQTLYCYDDGQIKTYAGYQVVTSVDEVAACAFDYVILTLDGAACRNDDGVKLLRALGDAIRSTAAVVIFCGVGIGLREHLLTTLGLSDDRLLEGTLGNISHQVSAKLPVHSPTDPVLISQATMAYRHFSGTTGFTLVTLSKATAQKFAALYDRCGISRCALVNATFYRYYTNAFYCFTFTWDMAGWKDVANFAAQPELVSLCVAAMKDIASLSRFGCIGRLVRLVLSKRMFIKVVRKAERDFLPLDLAGFNRFHHGDKVLAQDIQLMNNCLNEGRAEGKSMAALDELLQKFAAHRAKGEAA